jgi:hypothetical protein
MPIPTRINPVQNFTVSFFKTDINVVPKLRLPARLDFSIKFYVHVSYQVFANSVHEILSQN